MNGSNTEYFTPPASRMAYCWGVLLKAKMVSAIPACNLVSCKKIQQSYSITTLVYGILLGCIVEGKDG